MHAPLENDTNTIHLSINPWENNGWIWGKRRGGGGGETIQSKDFKNESLKWKKNIMHWYYNTKTSTDPKCRWQQKSKAGRTYVSSGMREATEIKRMEGLRLPLARLLKIKEIPIDDTLCNWFYKSSCITFFPYSMDNSSCSSKSGELRCPKNI